jgi:hypothetical protein
MGGEEGGEREDVEGGAAGAVAVEEGAREVEGVAAGVRAAAALGLNPSSAADAAKLFGTGAAIGSGGGGIREEEDEECEEEGMTIGGCGRAVEGGEGVIVVVAEGTGCNSASRAVTRVGSGHDPTAGRLVDEARLLDEFGDVESSIIDDEEEDGIVSMLLSVMLQSVEEEVELAEDGS